jgi:putative alpha-1,2-mannosidase
MDEMYQNRIDGLCGNDDCGQMSAWYIFSAMGFYPVCPGSDQYVIGAPYFPKITVRLSEGKEFTVLANNISSKNIYVQSTTLNGKPLDRYFLTHGEVAGGGTLEFVMGPRPKK